MHPAALAEPLSAALSSADASELFQQVLAIYSVRDLTDRLQQAGFSCWTPALLNRIRQGKTALPPLCEAELSLLQGLLPSRPAHYDNPEFRFIDLFAGIGGIRKGFEAIGGKCVFTSEWNKEAVRTYKANHYSDPLEHHFNTDIRQVTQPEGLTDDEAIYRAIDAAIPDHQVLLAGFPCQPFFAGGRQQEKCAGPCSWL